MSDGVCSRCPSPPALSDSSTQHPLLVDSRSWAGDSKGPVRDLGVAPALPPSCKTGLDREMAEIDALSPEENNIEE